MPNVIYHGKGPAERINDRLKSSSPEGYAHSVTTTPTRTVTCIYHGGFQSQRGDEVKKGDRDYD